MIDRIREARTYRIVIPAASNLTGELERWILSCGLRITSRKQTKSADLLIFTWSVYGAPRAHDELVQKLFTHPDVQEFEV